MTMNSIVILAQTGSGFGDFVRQVPIGPIIALCLSGVLLVTAVVFIVRARSNRQDVDKKPRPPLAFMPVEAAKPQTRPTDPSDLPDLDLLVDNMPDQAPTPPVSASAAPAPARVAKPGMFTVNVNDGSSAQAVEVVTILRDVVDGGLIIQMGGKTYRDLGNDDAFRSSFLKVMRELSPIVTQTPAADKPADDRAVVGDAPEPAMDTSDNMPVIDDLIDEAPAAAPSPAAPKSVSPPVGIPLPGDLPKFTLEEEPKTIKTKGGLLGRTKTEFIPVPELDIAGAIEAYLQHKLQITPDFAGRSIHVHPAADGGVAIEVDGIHYEAVGDVTDETVRGFLSATIQEWQQRHSG